MIDYFINKETLKGYLCYIKEDMTLLFTNTKKSLIIREKGIRMPDELLISAIFLITFAIF